MALPYNRSFQKLFTRQQCQYIANFIIVVPLEIIYTKENLHLSNISLLYPLPSNFTFTNIMAQINRETVKIGKYKVGNNGNITNFAHSYFLFVCKTNKTSRTCYSKHHRGPFQLLVRFAKLAISNPHGKNVSQQLSTSSD